MYLGADVNSGHYMFFAKVKLKLMAVDSNKQCRKVYLPLLRKKTDQDSVECSWNRIKETYADAAKEAVGFKKKKTKKWSSA